MSELSRLVAVAKPVGGPIVQEIRADSDECEALGRRFGIVANRAEQIMSADALLAIDIIKTFLKRRRLGNICRNMVSFGYRYSSNECHAD